MNKRLFYNLNTVLLLLVFLTTNVANSYGYSWCVGDDGHVGVNSAVAAACCEDDADYGAGTGRQSTLLQLSSVHGCGSCLDLLVLQDKAVFFKRLDRTVLPSVIPLPAIWGASLVRSYLSTCFDKPLLPSLSGLSQTLAAHRTVVLRC